jgi:hypothetical protein
MRCNGMGRGLAISQGFCERFSEHQSFVVAGAGVPGAGDGVSCAGGERAGLGAGCFLAAASAGEAVAAGRGDGEGTPVAAEAGGRGAVVPGSGVMMLTGGVEAALGKSAVVGLPVAIVGARVATGALAGGAFHDAA